MVHNDSNAHYFEGSHLRNLHNLEEDISYVFKDRNLLTRALTHPSTTRRQEKAHFKSYEQLEFLGDKVLNLIIADNLYRRFAESQDEGDLSIKLNYLVSGKVIVEVADKISLLKYIKMSSTAHKLSLVNKQNSIEDSMEALIGAVYLDGGLIHAQKTVLYLWSNKLNNNTVAIKDPKTKLQEWLQSNGYALPVYDVEGRSGSSHEPLFHLKLKCGDGWEFESTGKSIKAAQIEAAIKAVEYILHRKA